MTQENEGNVETKTTYIKGPLLISVLIDGQELLSQGKCCVLDWRYLESELRYAGLVKENEIVNQVDVHEDGIRFVIKETQAIQ